jgi:hypothetical protein
MAPEEPHDHPSDRVPCQAERSGLSECHRIGAREQQPGQRTDEQAGREKNN